VRSLRQRAGTRCIKAVMISRYVRYSERVHKRQYTAFEVRLSKSQTIELHAQSTEKMVIVPDDMSHEIALEPLGFGICNMGISSINPCLTFTRELCLCGLQRIAHGIQPGQQPVLDFVREYIEHVYHGPQSYVLTSCSVCGAATSP
jgi:hypothetical protein